MRRTPILCPMCFIKLLRKASVQEDSATLNPSNTRIFPSTLTRIPTASSHGSRKNFDSENNFPQLGKNFTLYNDIKSINRRVP